ncbi:hypothetical protein BXZ70DRAFT_957072 [Cristinia sonorae]|uniref:Uncharacterized protein n=1 Tax=Cristinia sonorae TaxID=1940300 RepID=A0A8K0UGR5_9AGAR|nr:hypothetical protein BXZ70DRAFT_957072 [Cristinia sonorae]
MTRSSPIPFSLYIQGSLDGTVSFSIGSAAVNGQTPVESNAGMIPNTAIPNIHPAHLTGIARTSSSITSRTSVTTNANTAAKTSSNEVLTAGSVAVAGTDTTPSSGATVNVRTAALTAPASNVTHISSPGTTPSVGVSATPLLPACAAKAPGANAAVAKPASSAATNSGALPMSTVSTNASVAAPPHLPVASASASPHTGSPRVNNRRPRLAAQSLSTPTTSSSETNSIGHRATYSHHPAPYTKNPNHRKSRRLDDDSAPFLRDRLKHKHEMGVAQEYCPSKTVDQGMCLAGSSASARQATQSNADNEMEGTTDCAGYKLMGLASETDDSDDKI